MGVNFNCDILVFRSFTKIVVECASSLLSKYWPGNENVVPKTISASVQRKSGLTTFLIDCRMSGKLSTLLVALGLTWVMLLYTFPRPCILDRSLIQSMRQSGLFSDWLVFKLAWSSLIRLPKAAPLWFSLFFPSQRVADDDNLAAGLPVQRVYGLSFWSSYRLCSCPISRCVSHH